MKQSILIIALILSFNLPKVAFAQQDSSATGINLRINAAQCYLNEIRLLVEIPINKNNSYQFRLGYFNEKINPSISKANGHSYTYYNELTQQTDTAERKGFGFNAGISYNHYFTKHWYIQPSFLLKWNKYTFAGDDEWDFGLISLLNSTGETDENDLPDKNNFSKLITALEFRFGKTFLFQNFIIDPFIGAGARLRVCKTARDNYYGYPYESYGPDCHEYFFTPTLHLGLNIGWIIKK